MTGLVTLLQAKNYIRLDSSASLRVDAEYVGTGDGTHKVFNLDYAPVEGSLRLYVSNVLQVENTDFTISGQTITFKDTDIPAIGAIITASYDKAATANTFESYEDDLLETLIEAATKKAEDYTGRAFVQRDITEVHLGEGTKVLRLYRRPVVSITSVSYKDGDEWKAITDYTEQLSTARLIGSWWKDYEYQVVYKAGYGVDMDTTQALIPDVVTAVLITTANLYENRLGVATENIVGSVSYEIGELPPQAAKLLEPFRVGY